MQSQSTKGLSLLASKRERAGCHHNRSLSKLYKFCSIPSPYCSARLPLLTFIYFVVVVLYLKNRMASASRWHLVTAHTTNASFPPFVVQILFPLGPCNPERPDLFSGWLHVCWPAPSWGCVDLISKESVHRQGFPERSRSDQ